MHSVCIVCKANFSYNFYVGSSFFHNDCLSNIDANDFSNCQYDPGIKSKGQIYVKSNYMAQYFYITLMKGAISGTLIAYGAYMTANAKNLGFNSSP